jgi:hypothetical protein
MSRSFALHPTGPDDTYRRSDYMRGFVACFGFAFVLFAIGALAGIGKFGPLLYIWFAAMLLGALSIGAALIFLAQAVIGSSKPLSFAVDPQFVPVRLRDPMRAILLTDWNPEQRPSTEIHAYERFMSPSYELASRYRDPESIALGLEHFEVTDSLMPGSDPTRRLAAAHRLIELIYGTVVETPRA